MMLFISSSTLMNSSFDTALTHLRGTTSDSASWAAVAHRLAASYLLPSTHCLPSRLSILPSPPTPDVTVSAPPYRPAILRRSRYGVDDSVQAAANLPFGNRSRNIPSTSFLQMTVARE